MLGTAWCDLSPISWERVTFIQILFSNTHNTRNISEHTLPFLAVLWKEQLHCNALWQSTMKIWLVLNCTIPYYYYYHYFYHDYNDYYYYYYYCYYYYGPLVDGHTHMHQKLHTHTIHNEHIPTHKQTETNTHTHTHTHTHTLHVYHNWQDIRFWLCDLFVDDKLTAIGGHSHKHTGLHTDSDTCTNQQQK